MTCRVTTGVCLVGRNTAFLSLGIHTAIPACTCLLFSKPLTGPRAFFYLVHCLHIQATPNRGTYLLLAPLELKGQWDKALRTGQS